MLSVIIYHYFLRKTNFDNLSPAVGGKILENLSIVLRKVSGSFLTFNASSAISKQTRHPVRSPIAAKIVFYSDFDGLNVACLTF